MYKEVGNAKDKYAISILRGPDVVAYLPQKIYRIDKVGAGIYHMTNIMQT